MSKSLNRIDPNFVYLNWRRSPLNNRISYINDPKESIVINSSLGPYKNVYSQQVFKKNNIYTWQIKIEKGSYFKIGVVKQTEINNQKIKAFSDSKNGYAYFSTGKIRNGSNKDGIDFGTGYGPGDVVTVKLDTKAGSLQFKVNNKPFQVAFQQTQLQADGFVAAVAALHEDCKFSLTLPILED